MTHEYPDDLTHYVCHQHGTEPPFSGKLLHEKRSGVYQCAICSSPLFTSNTKFDSGTGWPSFYDALLSGIETTIDTSHGMTRTEVHCRSCKAHLGHVFPDGPDPTGTRYCINSAAMNFEPSDPHSS